MAGQTGIQWTDRTWNPGVYGCDEVSPGCANCYAAPWSHRLEAMGQERYAGLTAPVPAGGRRWTGEVRVVEDERLLTEPLRWRKPVRVFVNSMSDLFHPDVPDAFLDRVFAVMALSPQHTYQVLTKRPERMRAYLRDADLLLRLWNGMITRYEIEALDRAAGLQWPLPNVWGMVSAEDQEHADERIPQLLDTPLAVRGISYEPALGPLDFVHGCGNTRDFLDGTDFELLTPWPDDPPHLDWIIVGGESGPQARPFDLAWARSVVEQCRAAGVAVFVKQLGSRPYECDAEVRSEVADFDIRRPLRLKHPHGGDMAEWPADLRVRQFPSFEEGR